MPTDLRIRASCEAATVFHQSAHITDYLSRMHDFDVAPLPGLKQHRIED